MTTHRTYLGDGVYVAMTDLGVVLTTENGIEATNRIVLEPEVYAALVEWVAGLSKRARAGEVET